AGARLGGDERALALALWCNDINDPARLVLDGRILDLQVEPLRGIKRRQIVEVHLVLDIFRILEVDRCDLEQCEIALPVFGAANGTVDSVPGPQAKAADLRRRNVDV